MIIASLMSEPTEKEKKFLDLMFVLTREQDTLGKIQVMSWFGGLDIEIVSQYCTVENTPVETNAIIYVN